MLKLIIIFFLTGLFSISILSQSLDESELLTGDWHSCGIRSLTTNDTALFQKDDSTCKDHDCLYLEWIINKNGKFKFGWQESCKDTKIGYGLKSNYKWKYEMYEGIFTVKRKKFLEQYKILRLTDKYLTVRRII